MGRIAAFQLPTPYKDLLWMSQPPEAEFDGSQRERLCLDAKVDEPCFVRVQPHKSLQPPPGLVHPIFATGTSSEASHSRASSSTPSLTSAAPPGLASLLAPELAEQEEASTGRLKLQEEERREPEEESLLGPQPLVEEEISEPEKEVLIGPRPVVVEDPQVLRKRAVAKGLDIDDVLPTIPLDSEGHLTSVGSALHAKKQCKPCAFAHYNTEWRPSPDRKVGCSEGVLCRFCHFRHSVGSKIRLRPCKGKRERYHKLLCKLSTKIEEDPDGFDIDGLDLVPVSIRDNPLLKERLMNQLAAHRERVKQEKQANLEASVAFAYSLAAASQYDPAVVALSAGPQVDLATGLQFVRFSV